MTAGHLPAIDPRQVLRGCLEDPPRDALLPLLALSVLATQVPFNATEVGDLGAQVSAALADRGAADIAHLVVLGTAAGLARRGAGAQAADLLEAEAIFRWRIGRAGPPAGADPS